MPATADRPRSFLSQIAPALLMMVLAPAFTEWLLGGTRLSALIGFPPIVIMEIVVWGGGAVMLRALARKLGLGWGSLLLFGLVIAVAEEFVIQQTSLAPLVIKLKGTEWARAGGINYVYALWALVYEAVWVVLFPTLVTEMIFPGRRHETWLSKTGAAILLILFPIGALMAWYGWTHIARVQTFHLAIYNPPPLAILAALAVIVGLFIWAIRFPPRFAAQAKPPTPALIGLSGAIWATLWFLLVVLAFGIAPELPGLAVFAAGLVLMAIVLLTLPRWAAHPAWRSSHAYGLFFGTLAGAMLASFVGFQGAAPADLWFKVATNLIALALMLVLGSKIARDGRPSRAAARPRS